MYCVYSIVVLMCVLHVLCMYYIFDNYNMSVSGNIYGSLNMQCTECQGLWGCTGEQIHQIKTNKYTYHVAKYESTRAGQIGERSCFFSIYPVCMVLDVVVLWSFTHAICVGSACLPPKSVWSYIPLEQWLAQLGTTAGDGRFHPGSGFSFGKLI